VTTEVQFEKGLLDPESIRYLYLNTGVAFNILFGYQPRKVSELLLSDEWDVCKPKSEDDYDLFYTDSLLVTEEVAAWHQERNGQRLRRVIHAGTIALQLGANRFCEVGAGIGTDGVALARLGFDCAYLAEINQNSLLMMEKMRDLAMVELTIVNLSYTTKELSHRHFGPVDWLYSSDVFEHIHDLEQWLDGWIENFRVVIVYAPFGKSEKNHAHTKYTKPEFNKFMTGQGFEKVKVRGLGIPPMVYRRIS
jgi:hypothetical protein